MLYALLLTTGLTPFQIPSMSLWVLGIVPSPGKGSQRQNATSRTRGMPLVGIRSTGKLITPSRNDEQDNRNIYIKRVGNGNQVDIQAGELLEVLQACIYMLTNVIQLTI